MEVVVFGFEYGSCLTFLRGLLDVLTTVSSGPPLGPENRDDPQLLRVRHHSPLWAIYFWSKHKAFLGVYNTRCKQRHRSVRVEAYLCGQCHSITR